MKNNRRRNLLASIGLSLTLITGCQTWTYDSGMTLPSGHYLQHRPQYIPKSPEFPLERELAMMEQQGAAEQPVIPGRLPRPGVQPPPPGP